MRKKIFSLLILLFLVLVSCATSPQFKIVQLNDKFSGSEEPQGFAGINNRLSIKSSKGGKHIDNKGIYFDPFVYKDRYSNEIVDIGFYITHLNWELSDGFRPIKEIIFLTDKNERIVLYPEYHDSDMKVGHWNPISESFIGSYSETYFCSISKPDFFKISNSSYLEAKIIGDKLSQTYNRKEILPSFLINLKAFYDNQII